MHEKDLQIEDDIVYGIVGNFLGRLDLGLTLIRIPFAVEIE